jgi:hypothetical protein
LEYCSRRRLQNYCQILRAPAIGAGLIITQIAWKESTKMKLNRRFNYVISLTLFGLLMLAPALKATPDCDMIKGTGHTFAIGRTTFQGTASIDNGGQTVSASVTTNLLGPPTATEDGTLHATTSHTFVFSDESSFTTIDRAVLSPTDKPGLYRLNTNATISAGIGRYENAYRGLSIHGTINLITGEVVWRFTGRIYVCEGPTKIPLVTR